MRARTLASRSRKSTQVKSTSARQSSAFKIKLAPGEDSGRLRRQAENIARQLAATSVPIIGFLPGTNYEYLDLARPDRQVVSLAPLLNETRLRDVNELPMYIGVEPSGKQTRLDLGDDRLPHILVGGGTAPARHTATHGRDAPRRLSTDHDPLFEAH